MPVTNSIHHTLSRCAVCNSEDIHDWFKTDFGSIGRCGGCGQILRADRPTCNSMVTLHQSSNLHNTPYAFQSELVTRELVFYISFLNLCEKAGVRGKILDVGCWLGEFLKLAASRGFDITGIEPVREIRELAERALGNKPIDPRPIEDAEFANESFDAITMWDVIEHLVDPRGVLVQIHRWLKTGGYLGIATINHNSLMYLIYHILRKTFPPLARLFGPMLYNPFHTYYFTKQSLARLVENVGFEIVEHRGYECPITRLNVGLALKFGMRALYVFQGVLGMQGEQYMFARKP